MRSGRRSLSRRLPSRLPKPTIYIVCEGKNTEPSYFEALRLSLSANQPTLPKVLLIGGSGSPSNISSKALDQRRGIDAQSDYAARDEVWAVFDRDEFADFDSAIRDCEAGNVKVAFSNPCFELWLVLHKCCFDSLCSSKKVQQKLEKIDKKYSRHKRKLANFEQLIATLILAEERAAKQLLQHQVEDRPTGPPATSVYKLTRRIRGYKPPKMATGKTLSRRRDE